MAVTSTMLALGTEAPDFTLPDTVSGESVSLAAFADARALLVMFICNHCPYVKHIRDELARFGREHLDSGLAIVAINSNDPSQHADDSPEAMKIEAEKYGYTFPYLFDAEQTAAAAYTAMCTPDFFLFDADQRLVYRGQFDGARPGNEIPVTGHDLRAAARAVLAGDPVSEIQRPSMGCSIKWRNGNTPAYFVFRPPSPTHP